MSALVRSAAAAVRHALSSRAGALALAAVLACAVGAPAAGAGERPHDPWVVRCVLDGQARMITVALHDDLWAAWDTTDGRLHRAWHGDVVWQGAVYTTVHGPQPVSRGRSYLEESAPRWELLRGGRTSRAAPRYLGHRLAGPGGTDEVSLRYELDFGDGARVVVEETPETSRATGAPAGTRPPRRLWLTRTFRAHGVPDDAELLLHLDGRLDPVTTLGLAWGRAQVTPAPGDAVQPYSVGARLDRHGELRTIVVRSLHEPPEPGAALPMLTAPAAHHEPDPGGARDEHGEHRAHADDDGRSEPGGRDAHGARGRDDARSEHGARSEHDARGRDDARAEDDAAHAAAATPTIVEDARTGPRERGLALRLYDVGAPLSRIPALVPGQTPNVSRVVPRLDLDGARGDFAPLCDQFVTQVDGFLEIAEPGRYAFRLLSDDGSRLLVGGVLVVEHDGLHSAGPMDGEIALAAGVHPIAVQHFEHGGDEVLALHWRRPGRDAFEAVPPEVLSCAAGEMRVTSPGPKRVIAPLSRDRPGAGAPLLGVHPAFALEDVRPTGFEPRVGGLDWLPDGRLVLCTWDADGAVWVLDPPGVRGSAGAADGARATRIAAGLAEPLGLRVVEGRIFVLQKQELTELIDRDGDGLIDEHRCVAAGWDVTANFHEFAFGLEHRDGAFFATLAVAIEPGGASSRSQAPERGTVIRIDPATGRHAVVARGLRTPNGIGEGPGGTLLVTDNQGDWVPVSKLLAVSEGAFYGSHAVTPERTARLAVTPPVAWLPQGEIGNSPSQPALVPAHVGPYAGQVLLGDVTHGGLKRVALQRVDGVWQGCVFRFSQGFEAGVNRIRWGPDGALYAGGIGSTGNWGQAGKRRYGLQRLRYTGAPVFELLAVRALADGLLVELTEPLAEGAGWEPACWRVEQWRYEPTADYGGPKLDREELTVVSASPAPDGRSVFLQLDGLRAGRVVHVRIVGPIASRSGRAPWTTEGWLTVNRLPAERGSVRERPPEPPANVLTDAERAEGWRLLFDGATGAGWRAFGGAAFPDGWAIEDGCLVHRGGGGDLVTTDQFGDFELALEWKIARGGNSGIFYRVTEDHDNVWETGPEMQVLDDERHADGLSPLTSAGANYALHAPARAACHPAGLFNEARIVARGTRVEHWLNGARLLAYEIGSEDWEARVAASKFAALPDYGRRPRGHIALQDHGDLVWYRNIRIRPLDGE